MPNNHNSIKSRVARFYKRSSQCSWSSDHTPLIYAIPGEAPSISHAFILTPKKFNREVHLLSTGERNFALLGCYSPNTVGLQDQRCLSPHPVNHPLWDFPGINRSKFSSHIKGVIDVADRCGYINLLPKTKVTDEENNCSRIVVMTSAVNHRVQRVKQRAVLHSIAA